MAAPYYKQKLPTVDFGELNPKQKQFCQARSRYVGYGGARGGGKSHVLRIKALGGALTYPDIRILIVRREYPELEQGIIIPMRKMIPAELATYNGGMHMFTFYNGAIIKFGHYGSGDDVEYQGQEYDWIFIDEATQFTEEQFRTLGACLRGATKIPRRMYLTCNPGGIGHAWVKRLFIDREYQDGEKEKDYTFIHATVDDNPQLLEASPEYKQMMNPFSLTVARSLCAQFLHRVTATASTVGTLSITLQAASAASPTSIQSSDTFASPASISLIAVTSVHLCTAVGAIYSSTEIGIQIPLKAAFCTYGDILLMEVSPPPMHHRRNVSGRKIIDDIDCVTRSARTTSYAMITIAAYAINFFDTLNCRLAAYVFSHC